VTGSDTAFRSLTAAQHGNKLCRACAEAGFPLESTPIFEGQPSQSAYLYGQAPGIVEAGELRPWRGRAGRTLRAWLEMDEETFYATFYCASVTRCYPGRAPSGRGDRTPTAAEQALCATWREHELRLLRPKLVVTVGGIASRRLLGIERLTDAIGVRFELDGSPVIPLPHPSGVSGWLNDAANRTRLGAAVSLVHEELDGLR
jgi:uracil-DNA glycosylase